MRIPSRVDGLVCGALLSGVPSAGRRNAQAAVGGLGRAIDAPLPRLSRRRRPAACPNSSLWLQSTFTPPPAGAAHAAQTSSSSSSSRGQRGRYGTAAAAAAAAATAPPRPPLKPADKQYLLSLVGGDDDETVDQHFDFHRDTYRRGYAFPDGPKLQVSDRRPDVQYPSRAETPRIDDDTWRLTLRLCAAVGHRLRHPSRVSLESIYKLYRQLPEPRMLNLTWEWRSRLMRAMGTPQRRDTDSMLRYFDLVADTKNAGLTLRRSEWNHALAFAARYASRSTAREVESTLRLWKEMEREAHVPGNDVTFNILFDVASKAGNFTLADMIYREMDARGIEFNRFHHVSLIHYFGLKLDSGGIRAAYREMVESGEMIDTLVLNCVVSGLLRCGEEAAAEEMYERMKGNHTLAPELPQRDYMLNRVITKVLMMFSRVGKKHPELKGSLQARVHLSPDLHTYKLLVRHFAVRLGNINKVAQYLDEMRCLKVPVHPTIFLALFKGFYLYGGFPGSDWSDTRLDGVLSALYQARDMHGTDFPIDRWLVIWALRAVKRCSSTDAVEKAFDEMAQRWDIAEDRRPFMLDIFHNIQKGRDMKSPWRVWDSTADGRCVTDGTWL